MHASFNHIHRMETTFLPFVMPLLFNFLDYYPPNLTLIVTFFNSQNQNLNVVHCGGQEDKKCKIFYYYW